VLQLLCCETTTALLSLCVQSMSKRAGAASTKDRLETGSGENTNEPTGHPHSQFFLYFIVSSFSSLSERNFSLKSPNKFIVSSFFFQLYLLSLPFSWLRLLALSLFGSIGTIGPCSPCSECCFVLCHGHKKKNPTKKKSHKEKKYGNSTSKYLRLT